MTYGPSCACFMPEKIGLMIISENGERRNLKQTGMRILRNTKVL